MISCEQDTSSCNVLESISGCRRGSLTSVGQSTSLNGVNAPFQVALRSVNVFYGFNIWNGTEVKLIAALFSS